MNLLKIFYNLTMVLIQIIIIIPFVVLWYILTQTLACLEILWKNKKGKNNIR